VEAARAIVRHAWPLNVRELHQCIVTSVALARDGIIDLRHLPETIGAEPLETTSPDPTAPDKAAPEPPRPMTPRDAKLLETLIAELTAHRGNIAAVARAMGKATAQIHRWMKRLGIDPNRYRV